MLVLFVTSEPQSNLDHLWKFIDFMIIPNFRIILKISISENKELLMFSMVDQHKKTRKPFQNTDNTDLLMRDHLAKFTRPNIAPCKTLKY